MTPAPSSSAPGPGDRAAPGWSPLPARSCLQARGRDAVTFVDHFTTAAVARLEPAAGCEGFFTDARGWVLWLATILRTDDGLWLDSPAGSVGSLCDHLEHYRIRERVELVDESERHAHLVVAGPQSEEWLSECLGAAPPRALLDHCRCRIG